MKSSSLFRCLALAAIVTIGLLIPVQVGCEPASDLSQSQSSPTKTDQAPIHTNHTALPDLFSNRLNGARILQQTVDRYATAQSYQDRAVLYLNYKLEGRPIQEPHPFSTTWDSKLRLSSRIFNSQIQSDGRLLSCYVFDNSSANLDNQQLYLTVSKNLPIRELYGDSIVRHFLGGYAELPLDETEKSLPPALIPPPISLLTQQIPFGWLQQSSQAERLPDTTLNDRLCYVVRSLFNESTADIWIDQQTQLLVQISLPLRIMTRDVLTSGEIENVELLIRFHDATINQSLDDTVFNVKPHSDSTAVRKFIAIPESFPSELIGQSAPDFRLLTPAGKIANRLHFDGKSTALLWLGGEASYPLVTKYAALTDRFPDADFQFGAVYSDGELSSPKSNSLQPIAVLKSLAQSTGLPFFYDPQLNACAQLKIKSIPSVIVLDGDSKVQFAKTIGGDDWTDDLSAALDRVHRGENVAKEMQLEYDRFLETYHQQLIAVSAATLIGLQANEGRPDSTHEANSGQVVTQGFRNHQLRTRLHWTNNKFKQPGNISVLPNSISKNVYVLDGWRTVVHLDAAGQEIARHELELPENAAVSCLRISENLAASTAPNRESIATYAAFSAQGDQAYVFDQNWKPMAILPEPNFKHDGIRDLLFADLESNGQSALIVAFDGTQGIYAFDVAHRTMKQLTKTAAGSLATFNGQVLFCHQDQISILLKNEAGEFVQQSLHSSTGIKFKRIQARRFGEKISIGLTGNDSEGNWLLAGMTGPEKIDWRQPIGSQLFEQEIEPLVAVLTRNGETVFAAADTSHRVNFFSHTGTWMGQFDSPTSITGIALQQTSAGISLIISDERTVQCFQLHPEGGIQPVSNPR